MKDIWPFIFLFLHICVMSIFTNALHNSEHNSVRAHLFLDYHLIYDHGTGCMVKYGSFANRSILALKILILMPFLLSTFVLLDPGLFSSKPVKNPCSIYGQLFKHHQLFLLILTINIERKVIETNEIIYTYYIRSNLSLNPTLFGKLCTSACQLLLWSMQTAVSI